jgi:hypothetical protein
LYFFLGVVVLILVLVAARSFVRASPAHLAQGLRAFLAAFSALASTGLLFSGRFGLALITIGATFMAIRAMSRAHAGAGGFGGQSAGQRSSEVITDTLAMQLDHRTGELEGEVLRGQFAGRSLASLGVSDLLELVADCQREDPRSVPLLETYLDRRAPDWRADAGGAGAHGGEHAAGPGAQSAMDEATAWSILGLAPGASVDEIKAAHRQLMTKLHPDHGGSGYLAAQLNQAKDYLLSRRR